MEIKEKIIQYLEFNHREEDDFSFLNPGGDHYLAQFFYPSMADEYWEIDEWDRNNLWLAELNADLGSDYALDESGRYAYQIRRPFEKDNKFRSVIDLSFGRLATVFFLGDQKSLNRFNRAFVASSRLEPVVLTSPMLIREAIGLSSLSQIDFEFEELASSRQKPTGMKGSLKGAFAREYFDNARENHLEFFNLIEVAGHVPEGMQGTIHLRESGKLDVNLCKLSAFLGVAQSVKKHLVKGYSNILANHIVRWTLPDNASIPVLDGEAIEYRIRNPIKNLEKIIHLFTSGAKPLRLVGSAERISRKQWKIASVEMNRGEKLELDVSSSLIRLYLRRPSAIPLAGRLESFLLRWVDAGIKGLYV